MHRDPRRGRGHPLCRRPQHPGGGGGCFSPAGLHAPPGGGGGPRIRVPPPVGAGRPGGRAAEGRLRPCRGPAAVHRAPGRVHGQHPDPQAGMSFSRDALVRQLFAAGYIRRSQVEGPGQFSVRGDIVDIYPPDMHAPARLEFWDEEIDSISSFDLMSQRRDASLSKIYLSPPGRCCSAAARRPPRPCAPPPKRPGASAAPPWNRPWPPIWPSWTPARCPRPWTNTTASATPSPPPCWTTWTRPCSSWMRWAASGTPRRPPSTAAARS